MNFLLRILITALVAFGLAHFLSGIHVDTFWTALIFALILAVLNVFVKPVLILLTLPLTIITLGLFLFVVNTLVVLLASRFVNGFSIDNFWWGLLFALLLALITSVVFKEMDKEKKKGILSSYSCLDFDYIRFWICSFRKNRQSQINYFLNRSPLLAIKYLPGNFSFQTFSFIFNFRQVCIDPCYMLYDLLK